MEWRMKSCQQKEATSQIFPVKHHECEDNPVIECRKLVHILTKKTELLYRECRLDRDKALHIRTMGSTLAALTVLVNKLDHESRSCQPQEIHEDPRGFIYRAVRSCDLNRICDK
jgi:hypothetical protein